MALPSYAPEFNHTDTSSYNAKNISGRALDRTVKGDNITYSYILKEYRHHEERLSTTSVLRSSASCVGRSVYNNTIYEDGRRVETFGKLVGLEGWIRRHQIK